MTSISAVGARPTFRGEAYTNSGNEYNKCNTGKILGAGALGVLSGVNWARNGKKASEDLAKFGIKNPGSKMTAFAVVGVAISALIGLGLGAIVDACINSSRRNKADSEAWRQLKN